MGVGRRDIPSASGQMPAGHDEIRGHPIGAEVPCAGGVVDPDAKVLVHLEMKMGWIHAVVVPDRTHLLPPGDLLSFADSDPVQMGVEGINETELAVLEPGVTHDHHVSPCHMDVACKHDDPAPHGVDRSSESLGTAAVRDPVLAQMSSGTESAGFVESRRIGGSDGQVETIGGPGHELSPERTPSQGKKECQEQEECATQGGDHRP